VIEHHGLADTMLRVEEREAALPSMTQWRAPARRSVDWAALEADLGTALPSDRSDHSAPGDYATVGAAPIARSLLDGTQD
jgi:hypothetical protein